MEFTIASSCGNSPRMLIVAEIARAWAEDDRAHLHEWLREDAEWRVYPGDLPTGFRSVVLDNVVTHGRSGSCDGSAVSADGSRLRFAHFLVFASTAKTALIRSISSYVVSEGQETPGAVDG